MKDALTWQPREPSEAPSDERNAAALEREHALHDAQHIEPRLSLTSDETVEAGQATLMCAVAFRQNLRGHIALLGGVLLCVLILMITRPDETRDPGLDVAAPVTMLLMAGRARLHQWTDLRAAHRVSAAVWLVTVSTTLLFGSAVLLLGDGRAISTQSLSLQEVVALMMANMMMGVLHMSMVPSQWSTITFVGVVGVTSAAARWAAVQQCSAVADAQPEQQRSVPYHYTHCDALEQEQQSSAPSADCDLRSPVCAAVGTTLGLLAGQAWTVVQRKLYLHSQRIAAVNAEKERRDFEIAQLRQDVTRLVRENEQLRLGDPKCLASATAIAAAQRPEADAGPAAALAAAPSPPALATVRLSLRDFGQEYDLPYPDAAPATPVASEPPDIHLVSTSTSSGPSAGVAASLWSGWSSQWSDREESGPRARLARNLCEATSHHNLASYHNLARSREATQQALRAAKARAAQEEKAKAKRRARHHGRAHGRLVWARWRRAQPRV